MSLQDLQLPAALLAELYSTCLIEPGVGHATKNETAKVDKQATLSLGGNAKRISIFVADSSHVFINDEELAWLQKMLQACNLTLGDVAIVNIHSQKISITGVRKELSPARVLLLGPTPSDLELPFNFPQFKMQEHDRCIYLAAPSVHTLNQENKDAKVLKSKLWVSLQKFFEE